MIQKNGKAHEYAGLEGEGPMKAGLEGE